MFAVLLGGGFLAMHFAIGWENFATMGADDDDDPFKTTESTGDTGFVVDQVDDANDESAISVMTSGALRIPHTREIALPNGTRRLLNDYVLDAKDSRQHPTLDDRMQLFDVRVEFFDIDDSDPAEPTATLAGTLDAKEAVLQVGRDEKGRPSVREDRDMDLIDVVVRGAGGSEFDELVMRMPRVLVRHTERGLALRTPDDDTSFDIALGGDDPMTLTGHGLRAVLPSDELEGDRILELHVAKNPELIRGDSRLAATGSLDFEEDLATGIGRVHLRENVEASGLLSNDASNPITAYGDTLRATLVRRDDERGTGSGNGAWLDFVALGRPVELHSDRAVLHCERVDAWPGVDGEPVYFTASVNPRLVQGSEAEFHANRIHVVRIDELLRSLHAPFGFPGGAGRIADQLLIFEGETTIDQRVEHTHIVASRGIRALRSADQTGPAMSVGFGDVTVTREDLVAKGNDGFVMTQAGDGSQRLNLGPVEPDPDHRFEIHRTSEPKVDLEGSGRCIVTRTADERTVVELLSPDRDIVATTDGAVVSGIGTSEITSHPDGESKLWAVGTPVRIERETEDGTIVGTGAGLTTSPDGTRISLAGGATIQRPGDDSVVRGDRVDVYPLGGDANVVQVLGETNHLHSSARRVRAHATIVSPEQPDAAPVDVSADSIVFLPYLIPPLVARTHAGGTLDSWRSVVAASMRAPHVVARGDVEIEQAGDKPVHAFGDQFVSRVEGDAGCMFGSPARVESQNADGVRINAEANLLRLGQDAMSQSVTLIPVDEQRPVIELIGVTQGGQIRNLRITCDGNVDGGEREMVFTAPVTVVEIDKAGEVLEGGIQLTANSMTATTDAHGNVSDLIATGDATLTTRGITARGDDLTVDVIHSRATIKRSRGLAEVTLPSGKIWRGRQLEVDYIEFLVTAWNAQIESP